MTTTRQCYGGTMTLYDAPPITLYQDRRGTYRSDVVSGEAWSDCEVCGKRTPRVSVCLACQDTPEIDLPTHEHRCTIGGTP